MKTMLSIITAGLVAAGTLVGMQSASTLPLLVSWLLLWRPPIIMHRRPAIAYHD